MRRLLPILVILALPVLAWAKPKVAVAPLDGDDDGKATALVVELAGASGKVTSVKTVTKTMKTLDTDLTIKKSRKALRTKLGVDVVIYGSVEKDGSKKKITLSLSGKSAGSIEVTYKSLAAKATKNEIKGELSKQIAATTGNDDGEDEEDKPVEKDKDTTVASRTKTRDRDKPDGDGDGDDGTGNGKTKSRTKDKDRTKAHDKDRDKDKDVALDDDTGNRDGSATTGDGDTTLTDGSDHPHHRKHHDLASDGDRNAVTQAGAFIDGGAAGTYRTLRYSKLATGASPPPVGTGAYGAEVDAEVYPSAVGKGTGAGLGFVLDLRQMVGLGITLPGSTIKVPVTEAQYVVGARYRFVFGGSSLAFGASYWRQRDVADRSGLMSGTTLDMPDADYSALAADATGRVALSQRAGLFASVDVPYVMSTGMETQGYKATSSFGVAATGGLDLAFAEHYGARLQVAYDLINTSFDINPGSAAITNGISAAHDSQLAVSAVFAVLY
nr:hypothetical protein [Kofleriaceae bacterium]